ncbi:2',3'-cyclic-nucleotide 3'-phosphodiesteras-like protein [Byssothecium circinans]|uniref:2',3'-cyclic-nucleotide 3'-phosphodiesteras-like protein n=1 Tax=Byssothecium circinans TaxID=147558 RepID=A0A6A5TWR1_9PLEO|nr:2',3'-cyclic-nucleotide 3'-phosphodiesteras-like protein [Byssothecium circinans]
MPCSSLWLLPPPSHPLTAHLTALIQKTSSHFHSPHLFIPHITLTSDIKLSACLLDPQAWLNGIQFPEAADVEVRLKGVASEDVFVRKLYIVVEKEGGIGEMAMRARREVEGFGEEGRAERWVEEDFGPHLSLLYHDIPRVEGEELKLVGRWVEDVAEKMEQEGGFWGWKGGRVVLVPTDREIKDWVPIAQRDL